MTNRLTIVSDQQMQQLGEMIGTSAQPHDLLLLSGDLGAGKTTLTKGVAHALGIRRPVKSPTFTIVREYREGQLPLFHMDMYRLEKSGDLASIDMPAYLAEDGLVVIEWPQFVQKMLPDHYLKLTLKRVDDSWESTIRKIEIDCRGTRATEWWQRVQSLWLSK